MNVAINTRVLIKSRVEGVCRYILETTKRMVKDHPEDTFYFLFDRQYDPSFVFGPNVVPVILSPQARHPFLWYWWFERSVSRFLKKQDIDVFLSPDTYLSLSTAIPTVLVSHDIAYHHFPEHIPLLTRKYYQYYFPRFHKRADHILAVSETTKNDIIETYNLPSSRVSVAPNSSPDHFRPISLEERQKIRIQYTQGKRYFIYVGSIHPRKNVASIIHAFDQFRANDQEDICLLIIGRKAWNTDKFDAALEASPYRDFIFFSNEFVSDVSPLVASSEAMIYISLFEGFGIPILEAMHCEVPVITSDCSSMPEVAGDAAILVPPRDINAISQAMHQVLVKEERAILITRSRENIKRYSWQKTSEIIYQQLKKQSRRV